MIYSIEKIKSTVLILKIKADITIYGIDKFKDALEQLKWREEKINNIVLDLENVGFIDSMVLGVLTTFAKLVREDGGDIKLLSMNDQIKQLFDETGLSKTYEIYDDIQDAVRSFNSL